MSFTPPTGERFIKVIQLFSKLWGHLKPKRKIHFIILVLFMIFASFLEIISLGAIIPFLAVIAAPDRLMEMDYIKPVVNFLGLTEKEHFIQTFSAIFIASVIISASFRILLLQLSTRIAYSTGSELCVDAYRRSLLQSYEVHVASNTSDIISALGQKMHNTVSILNSTLTLFSAIFMSISISIALFIVSPVLTALICSTFTILYILILSIYKKQLKINSEIIASRGPLIVKILQESFGGIRNLILDNSHNQYIKKFEKNDNEFRKAQAKNVYINGSPRPIMEAIGISILAFSAYMISSNTANFHDVFSSLGFLALGAQRLLPALQQAYSGWSFIKGEQKSLEVIIDILDIPENVNDDTLNLNIKPFQKNFVLEDVSFRYDSNSPLLFSDINLEITKGSRVGVIGETGAGKSTLIDIIIGLLPPTTGKILIDGNNLNNDIKKINWQLNISQVPQSIFLSDDTISQNIAFGKQKQKIDQILLEKVCNIAQLSETIKGFSSGYDTVVGERGAKLSGGQRQRIGIARALYKQTDFLIFDEATSALDTDTEEKIIKALKKLDNNVTLIMITHRHSTLKLCDKILKIKPGGLVEEYYQNNIT